MVTQFYGNLFLFNFQCLYKGFDSPSQLRPVEYRICGCWGRLRPPPTFEWDAVECSLRHGLPLGYNFEITSSEYGHTLNANTTETRVRVQELVPFADYAYRVRFMNQAGYGYYSEPVQFQTLQGSEYDNLNFSTRLCCKMKTNIYPNL